MILAYWTVDYRIAAKERTDDRRFPSDLKVRSNSARAALQVCAYSVHLSLRACYLMEYRPVFPPCVDYKMVFLHAACRQAFHLYADLKMVFLHGVYKQAFHRASQKKAFLHAE